MNYSKKKKIRAEFIFTEEFDDCKSIQNIINDGKYIYISQHYTNVNDPLANEMTGKIHYHNGYEIEIVLDGCVEQACKGKTTIHQKNDFYMVSPNDVHSVKALTEKVFVLNVRAEKSVMSETLSKKLGSLTYPIIGKVNDEFMMCLASTFEYLKTIKERTNSSYEFNNSFYNFFDFFVLEILNNSFEFEEEKNKIENKSAIMESVVFIKEHYNENISVASVAERYGYSPNYFGKKFKDFTGKSFTEYLVEYRLDKAYKLIVSTNNSIANIATECGITNQTFFYKRFRQKFGCLPNTLRTQNN